MTKIFSNIQSWVEKKKTFKRTLKELSSLSDRELADIGVNRGSIYAVAKESSL